MSNVSVIMPNYNGEKFLSLAIDSVLSQTIKDWELIIIDDCSIDNSFKIIDYYLQLDRRICLLKNDVNKGVAFSRNRGIQYASGRYIAFLDSDDIWLPNKLENQLKVFSNIDCKIVYSAYEIINESNEILGKVIPPNKLDFNSLLKSNYIGNLTGVFDSRYFGKPKVLNMGHEDYILWLDLLKNTEFAFGTSEVLARYRKKRNSVSSNKFRTIIWQWSIYRNHLKMDLFKSLYYMFHYAFHGAFKIKKK